MQEEVAPDTVILFGSRARGDHHPESDLDLLLVGNDSPPGEAERVARHYMRKNPPELEVEIVRLSQEEFARTHRAKQHVAGQAMHYGVVMSDESLNYRAEYDNRYPEHWEATKQRLENTFKNAVEFNERVDENRWNQELTGFAAQQAVENGLRGILSARNCPETFRHDLNAIWDHYERDHHDPKDTRLQAAVEELLRHTTVEDPAEPERAVKWLTSYAARYRYNDAPRRMALWEQKQLQVRVNNAVTELTDAAHRISGTTNADLFLDGKPWER